MRFTERREFSGDSAAIWARVSNLQTIPIYWHGTKVFKVTQDGDKIKADVVFAFGGKGKVEASVDEKGRTLVIEYLEGPFKGTQTVAVTDGALQADWDVAFKGTFKVLGPWNTSHFRSGTRHALERICATPTG
jgi:hypothetical protein